MGKILVAYAGVNGMTRDCAERLVRELQGTDVTLCNLDCETPDLSRYGICVIGSCIRHGKLRPSAKAFLDTAASRTDSCRLGVFLCCGFSDRFEEYRDRLLPKTILENAFLISNFGGSLNPSGKSFWDKVWLRLARSGVVESEIEDGEYTPVLPGMIPESIGQMASYVRNELLYQN